MKQNVGPGEARNVGIKASDSEYLAFCDSDDYYEENFLYCLYSVVFLRLSVFWRLFHISFEFLHIFVIFLYFFILSTIFYNIFILIMLKLYKAKESIYFSSSFADKSFVSRKYLCFISFCIDTFAFILLFVCYLFFIFYILAG